MELCGAFDEFDPSVLHTIEVEYQISKTLSGVRYLGGVPMYGSAGRLVIFGGLARMMSAPSVRVALKTSGDIDLMSMGKVEA